MSILSVDNIQPIGSGTSVTVNKSVTLESGSTNITGVCTATSFSGSGSGLTNIPAANLTGTLPAISGANLTSLPSQVTINNATANRVLTSDGGTTLNGESSLLFDPPNLEVVTTSSAYGVLKLDGNNGGLIEFKDNGTRTWELYGAIDFSFYDRANTKYGIILKSGGDVEVSDGNLVIGTSGHGIDFSATGNISGTQSELLDDYEEGTWTPEINGGYSSISYHNPRIGYYTKVGNHVSFQLYLYVYQATGAAANVQITLPFTSVNNSGRESGAYTAYSNGFMSNSWNEKSGCSYLIGSNYSYLRPCKLTNGAVIYGNDTRLGAGANNQYLIICGQMFAA